MRATITIPDNLNEITLKQYKRFLEVTKDLEGEFYKQRFVEILCGIPFGKVKLMKQIDINSIVKDITAMLDNIMPAVKKSAIELEGEANSSNKAFVAKTVENNVLLTIDRIREKSQILTEMEDNGEIKIVGGVYSLETGKVNML